MVHVVLWLHSTIGLFQQPLQTEAGQCELPFRDTPRVLFIFFAYSFPFLDIFVYLRFSVVIFKKKLYRTTRWSS